MKFSSAGYLNAHGASHLPETPGEWGSSTVQTNSTDLVYGVQVEEAKMDGIGFDHLPPYNTSGNPPISLVFLDCCEVGADSTFLGAFVWPWMNVYSNSQIENQASLGWNAEVSQENQEDRNYLFWAQLAQGKTAGEAGFLVMQNEQAYFAAAGNPNPPSIVLYGDLNTRLHHVYTNSTTLPATTWWRLL